MTDILGDMDQKTKKNLALRRSILMSLITAIIMSFAMSLVMTSVNVGLDRLIYVWPRSWLIGFCVALPLAFIIPKFARSISFRIWPEHPQ